FRATIVPASCATRDQIREPAALLRERLGASGGEETPPEPDHLEETHAHDGCLRIVAPVHAVDEAGSDGDDVLEGAAEGHTGDVGHNVDLEVFAVEEGFHHIMVDGEEVRWGASKADLGRAAGGVVVRWVKVAVAGGGGFAGVDGGRVVGNSCLGELLLGDLGGKVGAGEGADVDSKCRADGLAEEAYAVGTNVHTLNARDAPSVREVLPFHLFAGPADELMRQIEDQDRGVGNRVGEGRFGGQVCRERDVGKVFDVFVDRVDQFRERLRGGGQAIRRIVVFGVGRDGYGFLENPHLDFWLEELRVFGGVFSDDLRDRGAPRRVSFCVSIEAVLLGIFFALTSSRTPRRPPCVFWLPSASLRYVWRLCSSLAVVVLAAVVAVGGGRR
ncbi:hypothetical protein GP486_004592, partial [Trichoglossum hirsutum]